MNRTIFSKIIGQLKQDENFPDWWKSDEVEIPFFDNRKLTITFRLPPLFLFHMSYTNLVADIK